MKPKVRMIKGSGILEMGPSWNKGDEGYIDGYVGDHSHHYAVIVIKDKIISATFDCFKIIEEYSSEENRV